MCQNDENMKGLRRLNFRDLISVGVQDVDSYTFDEYKENGKEHLNLNGYCIDCEEKGCNKANDDETYQLKYISHGTHSSDFLLALDETIDTSDWHKEPILFIYETPSLHYGIYEPVLYRKYNKHPSKYWYWIPNEKSRVSYPARFCGGYGDFILSAIITFRLSNVYMTNLVKCGLNNEEGDFKGLSFYKEETINNCYRKFLEKEIDIMKPKVIFTVGSLVESKVKKLIKDSYYIQQLPHPAGRKRYDHYKAIYFWGITQALHKAGIINTNEGCELAKMYLEKY